MMNYKPLYGNPMNLGNIDGELDADVDMTVAELNEIFDAPDIFTSEGSRDAWNALIAELNARGHEFTTVLDIDAFNSLEDGIQESIHSAVMSWFNSSGDAGAFGQVLTMLDQADSALLLALQAEEPEEIIIEEEEEPADSPEEIARANMVLQGLTQVYGSRDFVNTDNYIYPVLYEAVVGTEEALGESGGVTQQNVEDALEYFNNIAFPDYPLEELISCVFLVASGAVEILDAEEESLISDDSRADALCSERNKAIILAAFGADASANFIKFCNADVASRKIEWVDVAGRNIANLLGVNNDAFEQFALEAFDSATSEEMAAEGSALLQELVGGVIESPEDSLRQPIEDKPGTEDEPGKVTAASGDGGNMYVKGAVVAGAAIGLTLLYRKIREVR